MKLLLILDTVDYPAGVNAQLARRLADHLARSGHIVHLLELWDGQTPPPIPEACMMFKLPFADERMMNDALEHGAPGGSPIPLRLARLALHPSAVMAAVRMVGFKHPRRQTVCRREIERLDSRNHYDAAIAVAGPYYAAFALGEAQVGCKKAVWQMDPYTANQQARQNGGALQRELRLYDSVDKLFITKLMQPDYQTGVFAPYQYKTQVLEFPSMVPAENAPAARVAGAPLRCVFAGNLYPGVRTPHFALELFRALDLPDAQLVFVGGGWQQFPGLAEEWQKLLGDRLVLTGQLSPREAREEMSHADVLINLGNGVANQLPSKIFEYFGSGKPVLNLAKIPDDPALPYFERYPLACTVLESEGCGPDVLARVRQFLHAAPEQRLSFPQAAALFVENTPAAVADSLLAGLKRS